jgi:hypothetical protein
MITPRELRNGGATIGDKRVINTHWWKDLKA